MIPSGNTIPPACMDFILHAQMYLKTDWEVRQATEGNDLCLTTQLYTYTEAVMMVGKLGLNAISVGTSLGVKESKTTPGRFQIVAIMPKTADTTDIQSLFAQHIDRKESKKEGE